MAQYKLDYYYIIDAYVTVTEIQPM